jgi:hypothetical protein
MLYRRTSSNMKNLLDLGGLDMDMRMSGQWTMDICPLMLFCRTSCNLNKISGLGWLDMDMHMSGQWTMYICRLMLFCRTSFNLKKVFSLLDDWTWTCIWVDSGQWTFCPLPIFCRTSCNLNKVSRPWMTGHGHAYEWTVDNGYLSTYAILSHIV